VNAKNVRIIRHNPRSRNWDELRAAGHRMLDDMVDYIADIRERPVWQPIPQRRSRELSRPLPRKSPAISRGLRRICPQPSCPMRRQCASRLHGLGPWRRHAVGMLAEMLAAG
jgi:aromatic-L-amino-acid decarboxylase